MNKKLATYLIIGILVIVIIAGAIILSSQSKPTAVQPAQPAPTVEAPSNIPTILGAVMSRSIDDKGNATGVATTFDVKTDKIVYAVLSLKNVTKNTKLSYVRYLNGKYIDSKVAQPTKDGITIFYFSFEKGVGDYPAGNYTLKLYINGRRSQSLNYIFK